MVYADRIKLRNRLYDETGITAYAVKAWRLIILEDKGSSYHYEIEVEGSTFTVLYGPMNSENLSKTITFNNENQLINWIVTNEVVSA